MRDRLRIIDKSYKVAKLINANHFWKFCFGNEIPFQSPLSSLKIEDPIPTMKKMITLTQVFIFKMIFLFNLDHF